MNKTAFILISAFLILTYVTGVFAQVQEQKHERKSYQNNLTVNLTRFILNEARIGYERTFSERHIARIVLGFQYPTSPESFNSFPVVFGYASNFYEVSSGIYTALGYNFIFNTHARIYVSGEIYFNYNFYNDKYFHFCVGMDSDSYVTMQSMQLKRTGIKFLFGKKARLVSGNKIGLELDFFAGLGTQYRYKKLTEHKKLSGGCNYDPSELRPLDPPRVHLYKSWYPSLHLGVLLSMPFL